MTFINYTQLPHHNIMCIDMRSFFASVEAIERGLDPLKAFLVVVGDTSQTGSVVLAASPMMKKKYKIKTGNRLFEIPRVPEIKIVNARMALYLKKSLAITRYLTNFVPLDAIHVYSIDESWLNLDGTEVIFGDKFETARLIQKGLLAKFGLPSSIGIGPNMFLAKVAMDNEGKKEGIAEWTYKDVPEKLWPLQVKDIWGIGSRLARHLNKMGIKTVGQLAQVPPSILENKFGIIGSQLYYHAWGVDLSQLGGHYRQKPKSLGKGITLLRDYVKIDEIKTVILELADQVASRARKEGVAGKTIGLGIGYGHQEKERGFYRTRTILHPTNFTSKIYDTCLELMKENYSGQIVRKVNVTIGNLFPADKVQLNLFSNTGKEKDLTKAIDFIRNKFGPTSILRGRSFTEGGVAIKRKNIIGGHRA